MNLNKMFDLVVHMRDNETTGKDFTTVKGGILTPRQQESVVKKAIQAFMHKTGKVQGEKLIQAFTGSSDLPALTKDVFTTTNEVPNYDLAWQDAFKGISLRKGQLSWEINTIGTSATFKLIPEGGKVEFATYKGDKVTAEIQKYGMGIGISWETIEGRKMYQFVDQMEQTRSQLYKLWADIHYGLLATAGTNNQISYQLTATETTLERDIATINKGYEDLGEANKDKGFGDVANSEMLIYASPKLKARVMGALRQTANDQGANGKVVEYNVSPRFSWNANIPTDKALLVLPKNKIQNSVYLQELSLSKQDMESLNELRTYWTAFGATVADSDQVFELAFA